MDSSDSGGYSRTNGLQPTAYETSSLWPFGTNVNPCFQFIPPLSIFLAGKKITFLAGIRVPMDCWLHTYHFFLLVFLKYIQPLQVHGKNPHRIPIWHAP